MGVNDQSNEKLIRTVCMSHCGYSCGALAHVKNGVLTKIEPADFPEPIYRYMCGKGLCTPKVLYHPERLKHPMKRIGQRGEGKWQRISWDEALDTIAGRLKDVAARYGPESVGMQCGGLTVPTGGLFIGQRFASASGATWVSPHGMGMAGQVCADMLNFGNRWSEPYLQDHKDPQLCVLWGSNSVETLPWRYRRRTRPAREKGARMVAISPVFTPTAAKADEWIPIRPGTDAALVWGMINIIMKEGLCDEAFLIQHTVAPFLVRQDNGLFMRQEQTTSGESGGTYVVWDTKTNKPQVCDTPGVSPAIRGSYSVNGVECKPAFQLLVELAEQYPLERTSEITDVAPDAIRRLALDYATLKPVVSERGIGIQRQFHGDLIHRAVTTLAAVTGNVSLKTPEYDPIAALNWAPFFFPKGKMYKQLTSFGFYENHRTGKPYPIKAYWVTSQNPANSNANHNNIKELLQSMDFIVVVDLFMSATAEYADILLPGCTNFECTSLALPWTALMAGGHPYLQLVPKMIEPLYESRSDLEIFTEVAKRMGLGEFFDKSAEEYIEMLLGSGHPSLEGITLEKLREGPMTQKHTSAPLPTHDMSGSLSQKELKVYSASRVFTTPSGKLEFYSEKLKEFGQELPLHLESQDSSLRPRAEKYPLYFIQMHSKSRHHTDFVEVDWLRESDPEPILNMNPVDAKKRGLQDGDIVVTFNDRGMMKIKTRIHEGIRPGVVTVGEGWQPKHFIEGSYQELTGTTNNPAQQAVFQSIGQMQGVLVEVKKAQEK